jgi:hypothetical protein
MFKKVIIILGITASVTACGNNVEKEPVIADLTTVQSQFGPPTKAQQYSPGNCPVDAQYNGVYYFACKNDTFFHALAQFKADRPDLVVAAMTGNGTGYMGRDIGYYVSTEPRETKSTEK